MDAIKSGMKILVIDNTEQITASFLAIDEDAAFCADEIWGLNLAEQNPALILLNYAVRGELTPDYIRLLINASPLGNNLVVVGQNASEDDIFRCLLAGAKGYQEIPTLPRYMGKMIHVIEQGEAWISRKMVAKLLDAIRELSC